ncbi:MAG: hypothetical protein C0442_09540 [Chlorobiaceae bacterium]|nr:hypothetical protein [Chlorobiaceae bacterium]
MSKSKMLLIILISFVPFFFGSFNHPQREDVKFNLSNHQTFSTDAKAFVTLFSPPQFKKYRIKLLKIDDQLKFVEAMNKKIFANQFDVVTTDGEHLLQFTSVVKEWNFFPSSPNHWMSYNIDLGIISKPGLYVVQAISDNKVAYAPVVVSNYSIVYKVSNNELLGFLSDNRTGRFQANAEFTLMSRGIDSVVNFSSNDEGIAFTKLDPKFETHAISQLIVKKNNEIILSNPYLYFSGERENLIAYVYTNQPVYRPGQEVNFKSIIRKQRGNELVNIDSKEFLVTIKSPRNNEVFSEEMRTNDFGSLAGNFKLDENAEIGDYIISFEGEGTTLFGSFNVEEYKKPEFKVTVQTTEKRYSRKDTINIKVNADYYFGSPVTNATVVVGVYRKAFWIPWWYWSEHNWFYDRFSKISYWNAQPQLINSVEGIVNDKGEFSFSYPIDEKEEQDFTYEFVATVTDQSRRAIMGAAETFVTRGAFNLSISTDKYFIKKNDNIEIRVDAIDFDRKPVLTDVKLIINRVEFKKNSFEETVATLNSKTNEKGRAAFNFKPEAEGFYRYAATAYDEKGNKISAHGSFYVVSENLSDFYQRPESGIEIVTDKESYNKGDTLSAFVFIPHKNVDVLLTFEINRIISHQKISVRENIFEVKQILTDEFSPSFNINVVYSFGGELHNQSKQVGVLAIDKFLNVVITPIKNVFKPGELAEYNIRVTDNLGNPIKNSELSIGIVDESIYAIRDEAIQSIQDFFYSPRYSFIPIYSSLTNFHFNSQSRSTTQLDNFFFDEIKKDEIKKARNITGSFSFSNRSVIHDDFNVLLIGNKEIFSVKTDKDFKFIFKNIPYGRYDLALIFNNGQVYNIRKINVESNEIKLREFSVEIDEIRNLLTVTQIAGNGREMISEVSADNVSFSKAISSEEKFVRPAVRENFSDAPFWNATILTDENGEAKISLNLPDNLTSWRATVRGITKDTKVGEAKNIVIARKDLLVRMETPRFFREDDKVKIATIVHNYLNEKKTVRIKFNVENLKLIGGTFANKNENLRIKNLQKNEFEFILQNNSEQRIDWEVEVVNPIGEASLYVEALTNEESDALKLSVPILPKGIKQVQSLNTEITEANKTETLVFNIPSGVDLRSASLSFSIAPSIGTKLLKSLDDLVAFPYGCVEQTMSRFLPAIIVDNTFRELNVPLKSKTITELPKVIEAGLDRLYSLQHRDGGWGWWQNDAANSFMTAYVLFGLNYVKNLGYKVDESVLSRGMNNLKNQIENYSETDLTTLAYMIYSYSQGVEKNKFPFNTKLSQLSERELPPYALALVGLTYLKLGDESKIKNILERINRNVNENGNLAFWGNENWKFIWQDDNVQTTAYSLKFLIAADPNSRLISKNVQWLISKLRGFSWNSTQQTAKVLFALTDYLKLTKELSPNYKVKVFVNENEVFSKQFTSENVFDEIKKIEINNSVTRKLNTGINRIKIIKEGEGKLYFSGLNNYFVKNNYQISDKYFDITRVYYELQPVSTPSGIIYVKEEFDGEINSGSDLFVKIKVKSKIDNPQYLMIEDMFPSGFEIVKNDEYYIIEGEPNYGNIINPRQGRFWRWFFADKEIRDEKITFFVTNGNNEMEFTYILKAQIPGSFTAMPTEAYLMYYPEVYGNNEMIDIKILDK